MKKYIVIASVLLLAALLAACGGSGGGGVDDAAVKAGEALFNQTVTGSNAGCVTCHSLEPETVIVGPSLANFAPQAETEGADLGMSAEDFIRQSILEPNAVLTEGFAADLMPQNWGDELTDEQVDNLVAFLMSLE